MKSWRAYVLLLFGLSILVFGFGLQDLRLVRDDWSNLVVFRRIIWEEGGVFRGLWDLTTNAWIASTGIPRIFFLTWIVQALLVPIFGTMDTSYFAFVLVLHTFSAILISISLENFGFEKHVALFGGLVLLLAPSNSQTLFFLNNMFFSLPAFFFCCGLFVLSRVYCTSSVRVRDAVAISLAGCACQFSGEIMIAAMYGLLCGFAWLSLKNSAPRSLRVRQIIAAVPLLVCGASLFIYAKWINVIHPDGKHTYDFSNAPKYVIEFFRLVRRSFSPHSALLGSGSIQPSVLCYLIAVITLISYVVISKVITRQEAARSRNKQILLASAPFVLICLVIVPCLYGAVSGPRSSPSTRYIGFIGAVSAFALVNLFESIIGLFGARRLHLVRTGVAGLAAAYMAFVMSHTLYDIWGNQKRLDLRIWSAIEPSLRTKTIFVTLNKSETQPQLMAHYHSDAISDFQADWGISGRISFLTLFKPPAFIAGGFKRMPEGDVEFTNYWGGKLRAPASEAFVTTLEYGSKFADLVSAKLEVFDSIDAYEKSLPTLAR